MQLYKLFITLKKKILLFYCDSDFVWWLRISKEKMFPSPTPIVRFERNSKTHKEWRFQTMIVKAKNWLTKKRSLKQDPPYERKHPKACFGHDNEVYVDLIHKIWYKCFKDCLSFFPQIFDFVQNLVCELSLIPSKIWWPSNLERIEKVQVGEGGF